MRKTSVVVASADNINAPAPLKGGIAETIRNAASIGFDAVQFTINRPAEFNLAEAQGALADFGIAASSIATGGAYAIDRICLGHQVESTRLATVERIKEHIDLATCLGQANVVIGLTRGRFADGGTKETYLEQYRKSLEVCIAYAEKRSICLVHEAIRRLDSDVLRTIRENIDFIESFASPNFRLHIDSYHMGPEESDFFSAVLNTKGLLAQVDISDVNRGAPDGRCFDFPNLLDALKRIDYQDYLVFEYNSRGGGTPEATQGLHYIRSLYKEPG